MCVRVCMSVCTCVCCVVVRFKTPPSKKKKEKKKRSMINPFRSVFSSQSNFDFHIFLLHIEIFIYVFDGVMPAM